MIKRIFTVLSFIFIISSCNNDLDVITDWKEISIVYGLLNQSDPVQYIKVNKAFLGEGDAFQMAKQSDSINYGSELSVQLEEWKNGSLNKTINLSQDLSIIKDTGIFSDQPNIIYKTNESLSDANEYTLKIINNKTGNIVSATTKLIKDFSVEKPKTFSSANFAHPTLPFRVEWSSAEYGKAYQLKIRFHFVEEDKMTGIRTNKYLDWNSFRVMESNTDVGGEKMEINFMGNDFYTFIRSKALNGELSADGSVYRYPGRLDFIFTVGAEEFNTYMEVSKPSTGLLTEKPQYSNLENGVGIFSSRFTKIIPQIPMNTPSIDTLACGQYTSNLGFAYYKLKPSSNGYDTLFCN